MTTIRLADATPAWLDGHLAQHGGLAAHVPRTVPEARSRYLASALGLSLEEAPEIAEGWIVLRTTGALSGDTLRGLTEVAIAHEGRTYAFDELRPVSGKTPDQEPRLVIVYRAA